MNQILICLLTLLFSLSGPAMGGYSFFERSSNAARVTPTGKLQPHPEAVGPHTSFEVDPHTGKVTKYETYQPQSNPRNPSQWEPVKRTDTQYADPHKHFNKATKTDVPTPHVHDPTTPGGVRSARPDELPR